MSEQHRQPTSGDLVPQEEHRLREGDGVVRPPHIELRPEEETHLLDSPTTNKGTPRRRDYKSPVKFSDELKQRYILLLASYGVKYKCAKAVGVTPQTVNFHQRTDEDFAEAVELAMEVFRDTIEETIIDRAVHGWNEPIVSAGKIVGYVRKFDNRLLELLAKRHIPAYRDKQQVDVNVSGGVLVAPAPPASQEDWEIRHRRLPDEGSGGMIGASRKVPNEAESARGD